MQPPKRVSKPMTAVTERETRDRHARGRYGASERRGRAHRSNDGDVRWERIPRRAHARCKPRPARYRLANAVRRFPQLGPDWGTSPNRNWRNQREPKAHYHGVLCEARAAWHPPNLSLRRLRDGLSRWRDDLPRRWHRARAASHRDRRSRLGHVIGNYRLLRVIGEGGCRDGLRSRAHPARSQMAIKLLHSDVGTKEMVTRFFNEARAVNEIRHPNIIEVEDFVTNAVGRTLHVDGAARRRGSANGDQPREQARAARVSSIGEQVARARSAPCMRVGIVHRDSQARQHLPDEQGRPRDREAPRLWRREVHERSRRVFTRAA